MSSAAWSCEAAEALFRAGNLSCRVQLDAPHRGLQQLALGKTQLPVDYLLGVEVASGQSDNKPIQRDCFVRGNDLVATYWPDDARNVRVEIYWRAIQRPWHVAGCHAFDLLVSVQTSLLEANSQLHTESRLAASALRRLTPARGDAYSTQPLTAVHTLSCQPLPCVLATLMGGRFSYAEMIHPTDSHQGSWQTIGSDSSERLVLSQQLFGPDLEKGVILRARVRAILIDHASGVPLDAASDLAWSAYRDLLNSPLPLTV